MPDMRPQLTPKFWIIRDPDGKRHVRTAKFEHVVVDDIRKNLLGGWVIEAEVRPELPAEYAELFKAVAALDHALRARTGPHLYDLLGELVLAGYDAHARGKKEKR